MDSARNQNRAPRKLPAAVQLRMWTDQLTDNTWIIGQWIRHKAVTQISAEARDGSALAVHVLATVAVRSGDTSVAEAAWKTLRQCATPAALDALWQVWARQRPADLFELLRARGQPAAAPGDVRVVSLLKLGDLAPLQRCTPSMVLPLIAACQDSDAQIQQGARAALREIKNQSAVDALCARWVETGDPLLGETVAQCGYAAKGPRPVWLLSSLKSRRDVLARLTVEDIPVLDEACSERGSRRDADLAAQAQAVLERLPDPELQAALCQLFIETGSETAGKIAQRQGYLPKSVEDRGLFYFLTGQIAKYLEIDFDQRILHAAYAVRSSGLPGPSGGLPGRAAPGSAEDQLNRQPILRQPILRQPILRQRILRQLQAAGRVDLLGIIAGEGTHSAGEMTADEVLVLVETLTRGREWARLWKLAFEVPYRDSLGILHSLAQAGWLPERETDREIWAQLRGLLQLSGSADPRERDFTLPPAVALARIKTSGRINSIAFAPDSTEIALGTGDRRVFIWDFQTAQVKKQPAVMRHSVGKLAFAGGDALIWSEKSNTTSECAVQVWQNDAVTRIGSHQGSITGLSVLNELAFTSGRDQALACWNWRTGQRLASRKFDFWPRALAVHPTQPRLAVLHERLVMLALPDLKVLYDTGRALPSQPGPSEASVTTTACYAGPEQHLVVGRYNGSVLRYLDGGGSYRLDALPAQGGGAPVRGLAYSPRYAALLVGSANQIRFYAWDGFTPRGQLSTGQANLAAVTISPSGEFAAVGKVDGSAELWDLRVLGLPDLFQKPLANGTPNDLAALQALRARTPAGVEQPAQFRADLEIIYLLLFKRLMHDIQLDEAAHIQPGDFDILLSA